MRVVRGKRLVAAEPDLLAGVLDRYARVVVDVGTGDARTAYRLARAHPDWLVVGLDPAWQRMVATAGRSARKQARGGAANLVLVCGSIETVPAQLHGIADEVLALMPWGKLLHGIVLGDADVCGGLRAVARPGAALDITVGTSIWREPVPLDVRGLPELTPDYVEQTLAARLALAGWRVVETRRIAPEEAERLTSSWGRRLGHGQPSPEDPLMFLHAEAGAPGGAPTGGGAAGGGAAGGAPTGGGADPRKNGT